MSTAPQTAADSYLPNLEEEARKLFENLFYAAGDFTIVLPKELVPGFEKYCSSKEGRAQKQDFAKTSFEFQEIIRGQSARLQVSRAFDGRAWTVTVRWDAPKDFLKDDDYRKPFNPTTRNGAKELLKQSKWRPEEDYNFKEADGKKSPWLFSVAEVIDCLHKRINEAENPKHGLILVTGSTNAAKSKIARGLIWKCLGLAVEDEEIKRRPHLVTYEDPIEEYLWNPDAVLPKDGERKSQPAVDYTPRKSSKDCKSLQKALQDALRQTPTAFYIGEVRTKPDLRRAVEFGGTGHLVVATAHAGNLIEAVGKILDAVDAKDSGTRAVYVPKILAVIHLVTLDTCLKLSSDNEPRKISGLVPSVYRRSPRGMQDLISDGLASLMPHFPRLGQPVAHFGSLGRQFFVRELCNAEFPRNPDPDPPPETEIAKKLHKIWGDFRKTNMREHCHSHETENSFTVENHLIDVALLEDLNGR